MNRLCGRYETGELAGQGGFGSVYRGYDVRMDRRVAIKVIDQNARCEAAILAALDHKGLPRVYDICEDGDHTCIVMEWVEGIDLERYIRTRGTMSEKKTVRIGKELLEILGYLHSLKPAVIYQDLKPSNIMLMPDGHIKLIDFGTALIMDYADAAGTTAGTLGYGAPEQKGLTGNRHAGVRSDIYSWGAVMYSCLSGVLLNKPPYTMEKIRVAAPRVSYGLAHVISKAVRRNEKDRYGSAGEVLYAMQRSAYTDILYRLLFAALMAIFVLPFAWAWTKAYADGVFAQAEQLIVSRRLMDMRIFGYERAYDIGLLMISAAFMLWGIRCMHPRRFIKVNRSVFLSDRRFPGLWIGALLAGIIFGTGMGGTFKPMISNAEETDNGQENGLLPVRLLDENGNTMLLKYDCEYVTDGDIRIMISGETLTEAGDGIITIGYKPEGSPRQMSRTIPVRTKNQLRLQ